MGMTASKEALAPGTEAGLDRLAKKLTSDTVSYTHLRAHET